MAEGIFTGKTVEAATEKGLKELGLTREEADVTVLEEGRKKLFGSVPAKVRVGLRKSDGLRAADFLDGLMELMGIRGVCEVKKDADAIDIDVQTTDPDSVIGRHGETLDAMQCLAGGVANIGRSEYKKVTLDCEGYRESRETELKELADKLAKKAVETGHKITMEPMPSYERRIVHSALMANPDVKTTSDGREPARYVVIIPNNAHEPRQGGGSGNGNKPAQGNGGNRNGRRRGHGGSGNGNKPAQGNANGNTNAGNGNTNAGNGNANGGNGGKPRQGGGSRPAQGNGNGGAETGGERRDRRPDDRNRRPREGGDRRGGGSSSGSGSRPPRGKKEIHFGTFLGNSRDLEAGGTAEGGAGTEGGSEPENKE